MNILLNYLPKLYPGREVAGGQGDLSLGLLSPIRLAISAPAGQVTNRSSPILSSLDNSPTQCQALSPSHLHWSLATHKLEELQETNIFIYWDLKWEYFSEIFSQFSAFARVRAAELSSGGHFIDHDSVSLNQNTTFCPLQISPGTSSPTSVKSNLRRIWELFGNFQSYFIFLYSSYTYLFVK